MWRKSYNPITFTQHSLINNVLSSAHQPERFVNLGIEPPKGVLLFGPPGTGKTLCARAVANRTDACFIRVIGSELVQKYVGEVSVRKATSNSNNEYCEDYKPLKMETRYLCREPGWCVSSLRWPGPRRLVWSSLMKLMLLEVSPFSTHLTVDNHGLKVKEKPSFGQLTERQLSDNLSHKAVILNIQRHTVVLSLSYMSH